MAIPHSLNPQCVCTFDFIKWTRGGYSRNCFQMWDMHIYTILKKLRRNWVIMIVMQKEWWHFADSHDSLEDLMFVELEIWNFSQQSTNNNAIVSWSLPLQYGSWNSLDNQLNFRLVRMLISKYSLLLISKLFHATYIGATSR